MLELTHTLVMSELIRIHTYLSFKYLYIIKILVKLKKYENSQHLLDIICLKLFIPQYFTDCEAKNQYFWILKKDSESLHMYQGSC